MRRVFGVWVAVALFTGCQSEQKPATETADKAEALVELLGTKPAPTMKAQAPVPGGLRGKVLETHPAAGYTYLRLQTATGEEWAAIPKTDLKVGAEVTIANPAMMFDFPSKSLNRTFPKIAFGSGLVGSEAHAQGAPAAAAGQPGETKPAAASLIDPVEKAKGAEGRSIGELFAASKSLEGKKVSVRAKVMKFAPGILGKNWIHLQDGTGNPAERTHDVTVTTQEQVKIGDVVTVSGTVALNKDIGAGYVYPVLIEEAAIQR